MTCPVFSAPRRSPFLITPCQRSLKRHLTPKNEYLNGTGLKMSISKDLCTKIPISPWIQP